MGPGWVPVMRSMPGSAAWKVRIMVTSDATMSAPTHTRNHFAPAIIRHTQKSRPRMPSHHTAGLPMLVMTPVPVTLGASSSGALW